ncbi:single-stranded-DNA-specific exonuclease RecJ [bacterium BMS3Abin05]|nr:single-stranded-DNA-specific exonuclease RecJ [bacterium BMS3Abin05]GBE27574.1 single-stranded-DNA-specific exonuclease RecJ [bacterium BMS3Bbin03]HDZ11975.1 single-stranded-DNA-specific exonuclease RecJ [Bacteroidota bacterium]
MDPQWVLAGVPDPKKVEQFAGEINIPRILSQILLNRGVDTFEKAKEFFRPNLDNLHDPFLFRDMEVAANRIARAVQENERILIYGDYDVDGTTSVTLLYRFFKSTGIQPLFYIPDRITEGYGLSENGVRDAVRKGASLIITVDCGITAVPEVALARQLGIDIIITDHHESGAVLPDANAIINPKRKDCPYPFKALAGVGVAFKVAVAVAKKLALPDELVFDYLDLVAIGSAADIVPLSGENRILVREGMNQINTAPKAGIQALMESSGLFGKEINSGQIVFILAPRINAVGRLGKADRAVHLLTTDSLIQARNIAKILEAENRNRRNIDEETFRQAQVIIEKEFDADRDWAIVLGQENWHPGVVGIVASRIVEKYFRPTVMIALEDGVGKGSARSIPGFDIYQALKTCESSLLAFGGHKYAAGLSIEAKNIESFRENLNRIAHKTMTKDHLIPKVFVDGEIRLQEIDARFFRLLKLFGPFGPSNMRPVFLTKNVQVVGNPQIVGSNHLKFKVRQNGAVTDAIGFNLGDLFYRLSSGAQKIDMIYVVESNNFRGRETIQLRVKDLR